MRFSFIPSHKPFFDLFERSAKNVEDGARAFNDLMRDYTSIEFKIGKIKEIEHKGDDITHEAIERLNKTFVTPLDREDIHLLVCALDDIIDFIDATANRLIIFKIAKPTEEALALAEKLVASTGEVVKAVTGLRDLKRPQEILDCCVRINTYENAGDEILRRSLGKLFNNEKDPIEILKWKEIYEKLETALDVCEDAANVIEGIVLKNT